MAVNTDSNTYNCFAAKDSLAELEQALLLQPGCQLISGRWLGLHATVAEATARPRGLAICQAGLYVLHIYFF